MGVGSQCDIHIAVAHCIAWEKGIKNHDFNDGVNLNY